MCEYFEIRFRLKYFPADEDKSRLPATPYSAWVGLTYVKSLIPFAAP
jgi:hypothetical protein